jgi:hypothetical protein
MNPHMHTTSRLAMACAMLSLTVMLSADVSEAARVRLLPKPKRGAQIIAGPVIVPRGEEVTDCVDLKLPKNRDLAVNRVKIKVKGGSHHIHIYRPADPSLNLPDGQETCNFALDFEVWQLVLASQNILLDWKLPPGIAFHFRAREQLRAQLHFVDAGQLATPQPGWATFNLYAIPEKKVVSYAGAFFGQDRDVRVPPQSTATATTRCVFPKPVTLLAVTGHYHFRGRQFTIGSWDGVSGSDLYLHTGYDDPTFLRFPNDAAPTVQGLQWTCTYDNPTDDEFTFGPFTDENEHCNMFAFYYPTELPHEFITCVQKDQVVTTTVRTRE